MGHSLEKDTPVAIRLHNSHRMKSNHLSVELYDNILFGVIDHQHQGIKPFVKLSVPRSTSPSVIVRLKKFETTRTCPRGGCSVELSNQTRSSIREVTTKSSAEMEKPGRRMTTFHSKIILQEESKSFLPQAKSF